MKDIYNIIEVANVHEQYILRLWDAFSEYGTGDSNKLEVSLRNIYAYLDVPAQIAAINQGLEVKYPTDKTLIDKLNRYTTIKQ
jgi:hypothetical protein